MDRREINELWEQAKANVAKLDGCAGPHDFVRQDDKPIVGRCRCSKCGGELRRVEARWYELGLEHGRRAT